MALHLNGLKAKQGLMDLRNTKTKSGLWELIFLSHPVFGEEERRKREKELGFARDQVLVGFAPHFLLLRDQATYKRRFEEIQGNKSNPNFILFYLDFGEKP